MLKKIVALALALFTAAVFAASIDANKATQAELEAVKGIGPVISAKILDERKKGDFKDWNDMVTRVKGVGEGNAAKFSAQGLTVNGAAFAGAPAVAADSKPVKAAKAPKASAAASAPMSSTKTAAVDDKAAKKAAKAASAAEAKKAKEDKKAAKAAAKAASASASSTKK